MTRLLLLFLISQLAFQVFGQNVDWRSYGLSPGGERFSKMTQIERGNVSQLQVAWTFQTGELETYGGDKYLLDRAAFEATPLVVNGTMYFPTPSNRVFAIDAATGSMLWFFDPKLDLAELDLSEMTCRGISYWEKDEQSRLLMGTIDGRLFSINTVDGKIDTAFGTQGFIDLKLGTGLVQMTSAPAIFGDLVIAGTSVGDNNRTHAAKGTVRAYQISDGKEVWRFDPIPSVKDNADFQTGAANVWSTISVDEENGLVFLPTSSPSPDFYGGQRLGNNDYANSVVALDAMTGTYQWHFQVVHHDLWDYDIAAQPLLFEFPQDDRKIPALAIGTKMGHIFILNRLTGEPLMPIEERPVPPSLAFEEQAAKTQPFPVLPKPLSLQNIREEDIWGPTEGERELALKKFRSARYEGIFTPPSEKGTIISPGNTGGIHWGGMSYDVDRNILVTNVNHLATHVQLHRREDAEGFRKKIEALRNDDNLVNPETNRMTGTPYRMSRSPFLKVTEDGDVWVQTRPPWGTILGIDLATGDKIWETPLGYMGDVNNNPNLLKYGSINLGGSFVTHSGLTFVAATVDNHLRAFDTTTGEQLWEGLLPASGIATPMTYMVDGKQFIVIAAGGHGKNSLSTKGDFVVAFALPD